MAQEIIAKIDKDGVVSWFASGIFQREDKPKGVWLSYEDKAWSLNKNYRDTNGPAFVDAEDITKAKEGLWVIDTAFNAPGKPAVVVNFVRKHLVDQ